MTDDRGSTTVLGVVALTFVSMVAAGALAVAQVAVQAVRLAGAADLAALAGAQALVDPCANAARAATANHVRLASCTIDGPDVVVTVEVEAPPLTRRLAELAGDQTPVLRRSARAGEQEVEQLHGP